MGQAAVKATRRELRRAVGLAAVETIRQIEEDIGSLDRAVNILRAYVVKVDRDQALFKGATREAESAIELTAKLDVAECRGRMSAFVGRSFLGRLRWLVTGR